MYRLTIITAQGTVPMSYVYNGQDDRYSVLRDANPQLREKRLKPTIYLGGCPEPYAVTTDGCPVLSFRWKGPESLLTAIPNPAFEL